jgi:hypothetical protein
MRLHSNVLKNSPLFARFFSNCPPQKDYSFAQVCPNATFSPSTFKQYVSYLYTNRLPTAPGTDLYRLAKFVDSPPLLIFALNTLYKDIIDSKVTLDQVSSLDPTGTDHTLTAMLERFQVANTLANLNKSL